MISDFLKILPAAVLIIWSVRLFLRKDANRSCLLMCAGMAVAAYAALVWEESALFVFPFVYLSLREATSGSGISKWDPLIFIPSLVFLPIGSRTAFVIFLCIQAAAVLAVSAFEVVRYNKLSAEYYDTDEIAQTPWQVLVMLTGATVVAAVMIILPDEVLSNGPIAAVLTLFLSAILILFGANVGNLGQQPQVPVEPEPSAEEKSDPAEVPASASGSKLLQKVIDEKMYLDPTVSLISLAEKLHTNRTYLSNSIHACYNQNFSDFINRLRISYAVELMDKEGSEANIKDIALRSGYNHLQSFYRNFAQIMDMTPRTWLTKKK